MTWEIKHGDWIDVLRTMADESVNTVPTSPPYWGLRDYGVTPTDWPEVTFTVPFGFSLTIPAMRCPMGLEPTPAAYVGHLVYGFRSVRRVLRKDGAVWLNLGDTYQSGNRGAYGDSRTQGGKSELQQSNLGSDTIGAPNRFPIPGLKPKDLIGVPWLAALALQADGWYLRQDIIWSKPNPMPESVTDRCTKAHEYLFLLSKSPRYYFDQESILEPVSVNTHARLAQDVEAQIGSERANGGQKTNGNMKAVARKQLPETQSKLAEYRDNQRKLAAAGSGIKSNESFSNAVCCLVEKRNKRSVWEVTTQPFSEAHFATFPPKLVEPCILAGCPEGGTVLDPFCGAGTTGLVATRLHRNFIGIELNQDYIAMAQKRIEQDAPLFNARTVTTEQESFGAGTRHAAATQHEP